MTLFFNEKVSTLFLNIQFVIILVVITVNMLVFAGAAEEIVYFTQICASIGLFIQAILAFKSAHYFRNFGKPLIPPFVFFFSFICLILLQMAFEHKVLSGSSLGSLSVHDTKETLFMILANFGIFLMFMVLCGDRRKFQSIVLVLALCTVLISILGIYQRLTGSSAVFGLDYKTKVSGYFGSFLNDNDFGALFAVLFPLMFACAYYHFRRMLGKIPNTHFPLLVITVVVMFVALFFSGARTAQYVLIPIYIGAFFVLSMHGSLKKFIAFVILVFLTVFFFLVTSGSGHKSFIDQFDNATLNESLTRRSEIYKRSIDMFKDRPVSGWGLGTYYLISPKYIEDVREANSTLRLWSLAKFGESSYMDTVVETGALGFAFIFLTMAFLFTMKPGFTNNSGSLLSRCIQTQYYLAIVPFAFILMFHSHFRSPIIVILLLFQIAAVYQSRIFGFNQHGRVNPSRMIGHHVVLRFATGLLLAVIAVFMLIHSAKGLRVHFLKNNDSEYQYMPYEQALEIHSIDHELWYLQSKNLSKLISDHTSEEDAAGLYSASIEYAIKATELAPTFPVYWYYLGKIYIDAGRISEGIEAIETSIRWSRENIPFKSNLFMIYLNEYRNAVSVVTKSRYLKRARELYLELHGKVEFDMMQYRGVNMSPGQREFMMNFVKLMEKELGEE